MIRLTMLGMAAVAGGLGPATVANAAPLSPASPGLVEGGARIERVFGGCGPGFHPNPWSLCRPNGYGPRPFYGRPIDRPYGYYRPRPFYRPYGFYGPRPFL